MPCSRPFLQRIKSAWASDSDTFVCKVGCGKCPSCLKQKQRELAVRLQYDIKSPICFDNIFFTLTYDDDHLEYNVVDKETGEVFDLMPSVNIETMQKYIKRVRKTLDYDPKRTKLMYYITGEYGAHKRPHYHGIIYLLGKRTNKVSLHDALKKNGIIANGKNFQMRNLFKVLYRKLQICMLPSTKLKDVEEHSINRLISNYVVRVSDLLFSNISQRKFNLPKIMDIYGLTENAKHHYLAILQKNSA